MFNQYPDVLTITQLAEALHIGKNKAYELVNNKTIGHRRVGKSIRIPKACLIDYVQASRYTVKL